MFIYLIKNVETKIQRQEEKHDKEMRKQNKEIEKHDEEMRKLNKEIEKYDEEMRKQNKEIEKHDEEIRKHNKEILKLRKNLESISKNIFVNDCHKNLFLFPYWAYYTFCCFISYILLNGRCTFSSFTLF